MTKYKLITDFSKYTADGLTSFGNHVYDCMNDNVNFVNPTSPLSNLRSRIDALAVANAKTGDNTKEGTAIKMSAREALEVELKLKVSYVQNNSNNDQAIMLSSGFNLAKASSPIGPLAMPVNLRADIVKGIAGSVKLMVAPVPKAGGYIWQYTEFPLIDTSVWQYKVTKPANVTLALKSRTEYIFCVAATGSDPTETFSEKLTFFVV